MHITSIEIENFRSIQKLKWSVPKKNAAGWHLILGDNGSGKSSVLRAIALALMGDSGISNVRLSAGAVLRRGAKEGHATVTLAEDTSWDHQGASKVLEQKRLKPVVSQLKLALLRGGDVVNTTDKITIIAQPFWRYSGTFPGFKLLQYGSVNGWFSASYGPFRRFSGGDAAIAKSLESMPRVARHLSLFEDGAALSAALEWLQQLRFRKYEQDPEGMLFEKVRDFVNQSDFLPNGVRLDDATSRDVFFMDGAGNRVAADELSDGYRSVLSMTFELIRQMAIAFGPERVFDPSDVTKIAPSGVVLIDEVDAHLHPSWQKRIGHWFRTHFPNVQFIVTTHSPLVCQAAEVGSVFILPPAGSDGSGKMADKQMLQRLRYGTVLDAYGTEAFGTAMTSTVSDKSREYRQRLAELNTKEFAESLTAAERAEQQQLRSFLPTAASRRKVSAR